MLCAAATAAARRRALTAVSAAVLAATMLLTAAASAHAAAYVPNEVLVGYATRAPATARIADARAAGATQAATAAPGVRRLRLAPGTSISTAIARLRHRPGVRWAVPDFVAHAAEAPVIPDDTGLSGVPGGWEQLQWNFVGPFGVQAPQAWANLVADHANGGRGVTVAVLDTGVAYANRGRFRRSPDFAASQFVTGHDFVSDSPYAVDHNGHGTHVAGTLAEETGNHYGLTGLAYGVRVMPVRVLDSQGAGDASVIAQGVRFAVAHGARVINLSLEFGSDLTASDIPELIDAIRLAHRRGVVVVAAAGNEGRRAVSYPARARYVIAVGATTEHGCMSSFSNYGPAMALVAPGGGPDASLPGDPNCRPAGVPGRDIFQITFTGSSPHRFGIPPGYIGTSMATPHVSATAALIIASRVIGARPSPDAILARLRATARPLGGVTDRARYGFGLLDAAAATAGPAQPARQARRARHVRHARR